MLEALERGNDKRKWHTLADKVWSPKTLELALQAVASKRGAPGIDGQTTQQVAARAAQEVAEVSRLLRERRYEPKAVKRVWIACFCCWKEKWQAVSLRSADKAGSKEKRPLGLPTVRDRIVQKALHIVLEPIFERDFAEQSYGFDVSRSRSFHPAGCLRQSVSRLPSRSARPGRDAKQAVERVEHLLSEGRHWVVDADIKGYFDNIPHDQLMERVGEKIADSRIKGMIEMYLKAGVMESGKDWQPTPGGTPQGAVMSPLLANIYLDPLDHEMVAGRREMVRYADDFVILCESREEAEAALEATRQWMEKAGLTLHPEKTRIDFASLTLRAACGSLSRSARL